MKAYSHLKSKAHSRNKHKLASRDDSDTHVGIAELSAAAKDIADSQDEEFEFTSDDKIKVNIKEEDSSKKQELS